MVRQVKDAIPLSLGPIQAAVANLRMQPWAANFPSAEGLITRQDAVVCLAACFCLQQGLCMQQHPELRLAAAARSAVGALSQSGLMLDERALRSITPAIDQLNSVFNEVLQLPSMGRAECCPAASPVSACLA